MTADEKFFEQYKPIKNHLVDETPYGDCMFETFGKEIEFVLSIARSEPNKVWTLIEVDGVSYIVNGYRLVDRMGYFISEVPFAGDFAEFRVDGCMGADEYYLYKDSFSDSKWYDLIKVKYKLPAYEELFDEQGEFLKAYDELFDESADTEVEHLKMVIEDDVEFLEEFLVAYVHVTEQYKDAVLNFVGGNLFTLNGIEGGFQITLNESKEVKEFLYYNFED